ncbi:molybdopterin converting factor subunit 1 [Thiohalophilus thiocyanatoxydans]|uniref:Molybdopterin synthase sulfur carrier subunit n=1 Tax=Thiohalophilus thiocyanatoxydans TaxID=381308 RepID=A0A4R8ISG1_9GAMM|nr:molybdopterin converting factor subunit 1 [Thiohalophilus thiocyanatoxydans]TDY00479.1 molybdopterin synthase sulfur carrier subunit [Thiohalophilus thiocyanatoxydans]
MTIEVKFFASLREQLGRGETRLTAAGPMSVAEVWSQATDNAEMPANVLMALNMEYVTADTTVNDGDEVAFFPPVTGG